MVILLLFNLGFVTGVTDNYFELSKNLDIFGKLYREINALYVDNTDPTKLMRTGIDAMLGSLDPYTSYISEKEIADYRVMSTGQYGGVGAVIGKREDKMLVLESYEDYPADKAGIRIGDQLLQVGETPIDGSKMKVIDVRNLLRGKQGSAVKLVLAREGKNKPIALSIHRDRIWIKNVPYYGMINQEVGYIALEGFSKRASKEVAEALQNLKEKNEDLKGIILDLRGNPGGRLDESVKVANVFLPQNEVIVETRGRMNELGKIHRAYHEAVDTEMPLVILINNRSASASEIVAGAIQDLDRGVIIGQRSFGKGLVQNIRPLSYNTQLKVTTAKYYTPSGRCIQALDYGKRDSEGKAIRVADSLRKPFKTRNGRIVYDGGGVEPDLHIDRKETSEMVKELKQQGLIFDFATIYALKHKRITSAHKFELSDEVFLEFVKYVDEQGFDYETQADKQLKKLRAAIEKESYHASVSQDLHALKLRLNKLKDRNMFKHKEKIVCLLKQEIVGRYHFKAGQIVLRFDHDEEIKEGVRVLRARAEYDKLIAPHKP